MTREGAIIKLKDMDEAVNAVMEIVDEAGARVRIRGMLPHLLLTTSRRRDNRQ
ncbi:unnamed protein product [Cuscuta europaea]|uniref:Uncharacterized protein n=1 Tax=Cuscuta europaea TaxID=41803 RepID=A0A9P0ZZ96_CUSEU|nr:unnamed protein product [Cuscuta europaea]